ncbi:hypothetical protein LJC39_02605 [Parabacteroides sp. OttesenSCG-928-B22]|nr:hypothetical protein [Parabacteroides sp. OttesenSCG-928-B22]
MKRIYSILFMLAAVFMVGCSSEVPGPGTEGEEMVYLSADIRGDLTVKADDLLENTGETIINNLTMLVFSGDDLKGSNRVERGDKATIDSIGGVVVPVGTYDILLLANTKTDIRDIVKEKGLAGLDREHIGDILDQEASNLLMVSEFYKGVALQANPGARLTYNYLKDNKSVAKTEEAGYKYQPEEKVLLTRQVARIELESITALFDGGQWAGAKFRLDSVFMVNMRPGTLLTPGTNGEYEWIQTIAEDIDFNSELFYRGGPASYTKDMHYIYPTATVSDETNAKFLKDYLADKIVIDDKVKYEFGADGKAPMFSCYAFENHTVYSSSFDKETGTLTVNKSGDTRMILVGEIELANGRTELEDGTKLGKTYFQIPIKGTVTGGSGATHDSVYRNWVYKINVNITGLGSDGPDLKDHYVAIQPVITVENWKYVKQVETDE